MTRRRLRRRMSASRWGRARTSAMSSAQVTLVKGDLRGIARAREISRATVTNMKQNLAFAFLYNALGVPVAAGVLYPVVRIAAEPDDCRARDEPVLGVGRGQCVAAAQCVASGCGAGGQVVGPVAGSGRLLLVPPAAYLATIVDRPYFDVRMAAVSASGLTCNPGRNTTIHAPLRRQWNPLHRVPSSRRHRSATPQVLQIGIDGLECQIADHGHRGRNVRRRECGRRLFRPTRSRPSRIHWPSVVTPQVTATPGLMDFHLCPSTTFVGSEGLRGIL